MSWPRRENTKSSVRLAESIIACHRELRRVVVSSLTIAWELEAFGRRFPGDPRSADALWHRVAIAR